MSHFGGGTKAVVTSTVNKGINLYNGPLYTGKRPVLRARPVQAHVNIAPKTGNANSLFLPRRSCRIFLHCVHQWTKLVKLIPKVFDLTAMGAGGSP